MYVSCDIEDDTDDDKVPPVPMVRATCSRCGHATEAHGDSGRSVRRCLVMLREECPNGEENFYGTDDPRGRS